MTRQGPPLQTAGFILPVLYRRAGFGRYLPVLGMVNDPSGLPRRLAIGTELADSWMVPEKGGCRGHEAARFA